MNFKSLESMTCEIVKVRKSGYDVDILPGRIRALLVTQLHYDTGERVEGRFVCVHHGTIYLCDRRLTQEDFFNPPRQRIQLRRVK
jgi:hypothetical protein